MDRNKAITVFAATIFVVGSYFQAEGQTNRGGTNSNTRAVATPTPIRSEPEVISRADQYVDENGRVVTPVVPAPGSVEIKSQPRAELTIAELELRLRELESIKKNDADEKRRQLALNLDILTKAEQRVESLRKQYFEMVEKEAEIQQRLDTLELETRPDAIERSVAFAGSLRPEVLREARQKTLAAERTKLQTLISEVQRNKANIESNRLRADQLVERLQVRFEREIEDMLGEETDN